MSRQRDRVHLVAQLTRELPEASIYTVTELARKLLRAGATLQRLAEAQCNGDWPYDEGNYRTEGKPEAYDTCPNCENRVRRVTLKRVAYLTEGKRGRTYYRPECPECRARERVRVLLTPYGLVPRFDGDPRGPVLRVFRADVDWQRVENGSERGVYVS